jgi:hypothetical protein
MFAGPAWPHARTKAAESATQQTIPLFPQSSVAISNDENVQPFLETPTALSHVCPTKTATSPQLLSTNSTYSSPSPVTAQATLSSELESVLQASISVSVLPLQTNDSHEMNPQQNALQIPPFQAIHGTPAPTLSTVFSEATATQNSTKNPAELNDEDLFQSEE